MRVSWIEERKKLSKPKFKLYDKVLYKGKKWKVTFIHTIESGLGICYLYDLHRKVEDFAAYSMMTLS